MRVRLQGDEDAQYNLAAMHSIGKGGPVDKLEALKWYRLCAEQGCVGAMYVHA